MKEFLKDVNPKWVQDYSYLTQTGSRSYGTQTPESDYDFYGFVVPPLDVLFPHLKGEVLGFGRHVQNFSQYEGQHIPHPSMGSFDITIYNVVKYFQLVMEGNPNMVDSLFTSPEDVIYLDRVGMIVKNNRRLFLSQKMYHTFRGMMWSHLSRLKSEHTKEGRLNLLEKYGYDTKDAYHSVRMALELTQVMREGDLDIKRNSEFLCQIRRGEHPLKWVVEFAEEKLTELEKFIENKVMVAVPYSPDETKIKELLVNVIEEKYGSLSKFGFGLY